jgi:hypothetical protein
MYDSNRPQNDYDWMKSLKPHKVAPYKPELPYFDESFRLFINMKRDMRSEAS